MKNMKKILSVILALLLLTATFAVAASAETVIGEGDGVETFDPTTSGGQNINVKVNEVQHRYAVDLTFNFDDLTIDSSITWNVQTMKYDVGDTKLENATRTIDVANRSDMSVYAYATATDVDENDFVTIASNYTSDNRLEVTKATVGSGDKDGTATQGKITVNLESENWKDVAAYYAEKRVNDGSLDQKVSYVLTTVTVTISKTAN